MGGAWGDGRTGERGASAPSITRTRTSQSQLASPQGRPECPSSSGSRLFAAFSSFSLAACFSASAATHKHLHILGLFPGPLLISILSHPHIIQRIPQLARDALRVRLGRLVVVRWEVGAPRLLDEMPEKVGDCLCASVQASVWAEQGRADGAPDSSSYLSCRRDGASARRVAHGMISLGLTSMLTVGRLPSMMTG